MEEKEEEEEEEDEKIPFTKISLYGKLGYGRKREEKKKEEREECRPSRERGREREREDDIKAVRREKKKEEERTCVKKCGAGFFLFPFSFFFLSRFFTGKACLASVVVHCGFFSRFPSLFSSIFGLCVCGCSETFPFLFLKTSKVSLKPDFYSLDGFAEGGWMGGICFIILPWRKIRRRLLREGGRKRGRYPTGDFPDMDSPSPEREEEERAQGGMGRGRRRGHLRNGEGKMKREEEKNEDAHQTLKRGEKQGLAV